MKKAKLKRQIKDYKVQIDEFRDICEEMRKALVTRSDLYAGLASDLAHAPEDDPEDATDDQYWHDRHRTLALNVEIDLRNLLHNVTREVHFHDILDNDSLDDGPEVLA